MYDYVLVGAGLFNATIAKCIKDKNKDAKILVIEKRSHIAGNIYTENIDGIDVHIYGAHIFHTSDKKIWDFVNGITEFNNFINTPIANYKNELYNLPFNMHTFYKMWGCIKPEEALKIIEEQKKEIKGEPKNLEEQAISLVGRDIYEKLIKGYTEKQWGKDCKDLPSFIIKRLPVRLIYDNNYFNDKYQGIPSLGYTKMIENMFSGTEVLLNTNYLDDREKYKGKYIIYTGPIDEYYDYKLGRLEYRSLKFETTKIDKKDYQGVAVMNFTERDIPFTRIIEHKHFNDRGTDTTIITKEYPVNFEIGDEPYYPINDEKNQKLYEEYKKLKTDGNVIFGGRLGSYKYYDMDKVINEAFELLKKIL